jgi:hypothetical protein
MTPTGVHRAGLAIVRVELETSDAPGVLLRVTTVDDVGPGPALPESIAFGDADAAVAHVRDWLDRWLARR